jgi:hypothetical protein
MSEKFTNKVTLEQLLNITTWGETLREHLINGTVAVLKKQGKIAPYQYYRTSLKQGEDYVEVIVET